METVSCLLCGSMAAQPYLQLPDYQLERPEVRASLVRCQECGLIYQSPRPTRQEMPAHYPDAYPRYQPEARQGKKSFLLQQAEDFGMEKRCRTVTRHKPAGALLDIGCATGVFLHGMQKHPGWTLKGLELSEKAASLARRQYGLEVVTGSIDEVRFPESAFDAVTLWDVLEHLHDPAAALVEISRILKPDGILVFRIPNGDGWDARLFGPYWSGYEPPRHLYVFSRSHISRLLQQTGFSVLQMSGEYGGYMNVILNVRFYLTGKGVPPARRAAILRLLYHPIARLAAAPLFALLSLGLHGPSLTITAVKAGSRR